MSKEQLKPMDVYSDMSVPFDVAAYCRGHRFCPEAASLTHAIKARNSAEDLVTQAERVLDDKRTELRAAIDAARKRMERDTHA